MELWGGFGGEMESRGVGDGRREEREKDKEERRGGSEVWKGGRRGRSEGE